MGCQAAIGSSTRSSAGNNPDFACKTEGSLFLQAGKRRTSRLLLSASVVLSGEDRLKCHFTMPARATNLNKHGAAVQLSRELLVGTVINLRNKRGTEVSARVVSQLSATQRTSSYGIELVEQDDRASGFWGISFPAGDKSRLH